jgi:hypothetical protein
LTVIFTVLDPHDEENVTLPSFFFTVIVNVADPVPVTFAEPGLTCICPLLLEVAVIVPLPLKLFRFALTVPEPFWAMVNEPGFAEIEQATGLAVGDGDAEGEADGDAEGEADGDGDADGDAAGDGDADGEADGDGDGEADGDGDGEADGPGEETGVGEASAITLPPEPLSVVAGMSLS